MMSGYDRRLGPCSEYCAVMDECEARGDVIKELRTENERLREALKNVLDDSFGQRAAFTNVRSISVGTLVAVREALGETE